MSKTVRPVTIAAAATAVRLHGMAHLHWVAPVAPWRGAPEVCRSSICPLGLGVS